MIGGVVNGTDSPISVAEHRAFVRDLLTSTPVQERALAECAGLALAEDLVSPIALPPFDNSAMDGYAVRAAELDAADADDPVVLPVAADIPAGRTDSPPLLPGTAHRIMTGARVPVGADSVLQVEKTDGGVPRVACHSPVRHGANIRRAGEDITAGTTVLRAGTELGASQLAIAAAIGRATLPVGRPPHVLVLSTGSELVAPGEELLPGQIYESNGLMLACAVREAGGTAELLRFVPDDVSAFRAALDDRLDQVDLILTSGGVSAGAYEVVKDALTGHGVRFRKVAMQPGMPQGAGRYRDAVAVATLPGNPVSSMVSFEVFVRPALRAAAGFTETERPRVAAKLTESLSSSPGKRQFRRGVHDPAAGTVTPLGGPGSHLLAAMAQANCLVEIPEDTTELDESSTVDILRLD